MLAPATKTNCVVRIINDCDRLATAPGGLALPHCGCLSKLSLREQ